MGELTRASLVERMIQNQIIARGVTDQRTLDAMRRVPRDRFFTGPRREDAYADRATAIGFGQTISQPYVVALMTEKLDVRPEHRVLEIGTGSGYQTAVLSKLATEVFTVERVKPLLDDSFERLGDLGIRNVRFKFGDGTLGWPDRAPFDRILIAAAAPQMPTELLREQLRDGGLAVLPVGLHDNQQLHLITRNGDELQYQNHAPVRFVPLVGRDGFPQAR